MRILSVIVRNYRVHRELTVVFKGPLTLIGGPNESGKSTLIEALHRAFFMRAKTTGDAQKSMVSTCWHGAPEVTVRFEAAGAEYTLTKRFSGANGTTRLAKEAGANWAGDEAEQELAGLLKAGQVGKGRGLNERLSDQWSHLWAWQGEGGRNPADYATRQKTDLIQRLQQTGAGALQSDLDARISARFAQAVAAIFTSSDKPKAGSDLEKAEKEWAEAVEAERRAAERLASLQEQVRNFHEATQELAQLGKELRELDDQRTRVEAKLVQVEQLRRLESEQLRELTSAQASHAQRKQQEMTILAARQSLAGLRSALTPKTEELTTRSAAFEKVQGTASQASRSLDLASEKTRSSRLRRDLAAAWVRRGEREARLKEVESREAQVLSQQARLRHLHDDLAAVPDVSVPKLKKLEELERQLREGEAGLRAMAAGIEILTATVPVRAGDQVLAPGQSHVLTETTELIVGDECRLKISPGGGTTLERTRVEVSEFRSTLREQLDELGLPTVAAAQEAVLRRKELLGDIRKAKESLQTFKADELDHDLTQARSDLAAAKAGLERRTQTLPGAAPPETQDRGAWLRSEERALELAEREEAESKQIRDGAGQALAHAVEALQALRAQIDKDTRELERVRAQLDLLLETHGDDTTRAKALSDTAHAEQLALATLNGTRAKLQELQPDLLDHDHARLKRATEQKTEAKAQAERRRFLAEAALRFDGAENPQETHALAVARRCSAEKSRAGHRRKAEALRLLDGLYREQQQALAGEFTRPLAERISAYLRCLFGPSARAVMTLTPDGFTGLALVRPAERAGPGDFDTLSGGAKEQLAAAVRLAMAEILAPAHDGCLPVVLDDAFAYSDPERVQTLQRMLDLAARNGLQLIVLTCNPSDYATLGAQQIMLRPETADPEAPLATADVPDGGSVRMPEPPG
jgi:DNA repair exonuclease SbcCD ATPase subunit